MKQRKFSTDVLTHFDICLLSSIQYCTNCRLGWNLDILNLFYFLNPINNTENVMAYQKQTHYFIELASEWYSVSCTRL